MLSAIAKQVSSVTKYLIVGLVASTLVLVPPQPEPAAASAAIVHSDGVCQLSTAGFDGDGSEANPYQIPDAISLWEVSDCSITNSAAAHFELFRNIDLAGASGAPTTSPIGISMSGESRPFEGIFDGRGFSITGLAISGSYAVGTPAGSGLFWGIENAEIANLKVAGFVFRGSGLNTGGLAGWAKNSTLSEISMNVEVSGPLNVGGLVGFGLGSLTLSDVVNMGAVSGGDLVGGLIGFSAQNLSVIGSTNTASVSGQANTGGLIGLTTGYADVRGSSNSGLVEGSLFTGGLIGSAVDSRLFEVTVSGSVSGSESVGGFIGFVSSYSLILASENIGSKVSGGLNVGGIVGAANTLYFHEVWNKSLVSGSYAVGGFVGESQGRVDLHENFNEGEVEGIDGVGGFVGSASGMVLVWQSINRVTQDASPPDGIYGQLNVGGFVGQAAGVNVLDSLNESFVSGTEAVGGFVGRADTLTVATALNTLPILGNLRVGGFVGLASTISIELSTNSGEVTGMQSAGGLVGEGSQISISASINTSDGTVFGEEWVGGLVGYADRVVISTSKNSAGVIGGVRSVGGLIGSVGAATISNSINDGFINGRDQTGGLVGQSGTALFITSSSNLGAVSGSEAVGGLVGKIFLNGSIGSSRNEAMINAGDYVGGLVGQAAGSLRIQLSLNRGIVDARGLEVGGLVGSANAVSISKAFNHESVFGGAFVGGLLGSSVYMEVVDAYNLGSIRATGAFGGLFGNVSGASRISNAFNAGAVSAGGDGLFGTADGSAEVSIENTYTSRPTEYTRSNSVEEMRSAALYSGWDFNSIWGFGACDEENGLPSLRFAEFVPVFYSQGCYSAPVPTPPSSPDVVRQPTTGYNGPTITSGRQQATPGAEVSFSGNKLDQITSAKLGTLDLVILSKSAGQITFVIPVSASARSYDLVFDSAFGKLFLSDILSVIQPVTVAPDGAVTQSPVVGPELSSLIGKTVLLPGKANVTSPNRSVVALSTKQRSSLASRYKGSILTRVVCSALVTRGASHRERVEVRKLAKAACDESRRLMPGASVWHQTKFTNKIGLARRVALTFKG